MKRLLCILLAILCLAAVFAGCNKNKENDKDKDKEQEQSSSAALPSIVPSPTSLFVPTPEPKAYLADVKADGGLNVRAAPSTDAEILGLVDDGGTLPLLKETPSDNWYQVEYNGETAYVFGDFVTVREVTLSEYNKVRGVDEETNSGASAGRGDTSSAAGESPAPGESGVSEPSTQPTASPTSTPSSGIAVQDGE